MPAFKLATAVQMDSTLPRDAIMINPVFNFTLGVADPQSLCNDWAAALKGWAGWSSQPQITVKAYELGKPKPNPPAAEKVLNVGTSHPSQHPREVALCLSFYSQFNRPRRRGRLYIPVTWLNVAGAAGLRPTTEHRDKVAALVPLLTGLGGVDVDWSVWSGTDSQARAVSNWWVDDEWDTQRPRGMRPTTRTAGTTSE